MGTDQKISISVSSKGIQIGNTSSWVDKNGVTHKIKCNITLQGIELEWGKSQNNSTTGGGIKLNLNLDPTESLVFYDYTSLTKGDITTRNETGICINLGVLALAVVAVVVLGTEGVAALGTVGSAAGGIVLTLLLLSVINEKVNNNLCDLEKS